MAAVTAVVGSCRPRPRCKSVRRAPHLCCPHNNSQLARVAIRISARDRAHPTILDEWSATHTLGLLRARSRFPEIVGNIKNAEQGMEGLEGANALAKQVLSQLSYTPTVGVPFILRHFRRFQNPFLRFSVITGVNPYFETVFGGRTSSTEGERSKADPYCHTRREHRLAEPRAWSLRTCPHPERLPHR